jgi:hypothetical protein
MQEVFILIFLFCLAWSVSLNPQRETYASTGISGNVFIHSAQIDNFGERLSTLSSGRNKFGMFCAHVRLYYPATLFSFSLTQPHDRAQTVDELLCLRKVDRFIYLISKQALYRSHLLLMPCLYVQLHGPRTQMYVFMFISLFNHLLKLIN